MRSDSLVFSHQRQVVLSLAELYDRVFVFTVESDSAELSSNVEVITIPWKSNSIFSNFFRVLLTSIPIILKHRNAVVFSHMTDVQSAIISPFTRLLGIQHFLWYAHTKKSIFLRWSHFWVTGIITSTKDSCPYRDNKTIAIGQSIDTSRFNYRTKKRGKITRGVYVGRFDNSKNLNLISDVIRSASALGLDVSIDLIGRPTLGNETFFELFLQRNSDLVEIGRLVILGKVENHKLPSVLADYDFFINAFVGSLDKTLLEATLVGLPVVTINPPYLREMGSWSESDSDSLQTKLMSELISICQLSPIQLEANCRQRANIALKSHGRDAWIANLHQVLTDVS